MVSVVTFHCHKLDKFVSCSKLYPGVPLAAIFVPPPPSNDVVPGIRGSSEVLYSAAETQFPCITRVKLGISPADVCQYVLGVLSAAPGHSFEQHVAVKIAGIRPVDFLEPACSPEIPSFGALLFILGVPGVEHTKLEGMLAGDFGEIVLPGKQILAVRARRLDTKVGRAPANRGGQILGVQLSADWDNGGNLGPNLSAQCLVVPSAGNANIAPRPRELEVIDRR